MFGIAEFSSIIGKRGLARPTHYCVNFTPPAAINDPIVGDLPFMVDTCNLPGAQFGMEDYRHKGYGHTESRPTSVTFEPVTMTLIGDAQGKVLNFLNNWITLIHNMDADGPNSTTKNGVPIELFNYPSEYWGTVEIYLYDPGGNTYQIQTINKSFPINIAGVQLGWQQTDQLMAISVTFAYRSPSIETIDIYSEDSSINNYTGDNNYRNVNALENLLINPNIQDYQARFEAF